MKNTDSGSKRRTTIQKYLFITAICIVPITQFMIFYFCVNFNSILLAFKTYDGGNLYLNAGFSNFAKFFSDIVKDESMIFAIKNSAVQYAASVLISMPISLFVSYLIWKGIPLSGAFKVILMLPSMISGTVFAIIARYFLEVGVPNLLNNPEMNSLIYSANTTFQTILLYDMWLGFAGNLVLYLGAMSNISVDVVEYGKIDGMNSFHEFIHVVIPGIWPTITMFLVAGVAGFFTNYGSRYTFFEQPWQSPVQGYTLGFYFFTMVANEGVPKYPYAAAGGLMFTAVAVPVTLFAKWALEKFGPRED